MNELALFAGAGGGLLGSRLLGWRAVCYVECNKYCVEVLKARIQDGCLDDAPIWDDVRTFDGCPWAGSVDIVTAGFPCQPFSGAGRQLGEHDSRNLWPDTLRIIREVRPEWVLLENVSRLLSSAYVRRIFGDLAESGYDAEWDCIPACAIGAPHIRDRVWIVAHACGQPGGLCLQPRVEGVEAGGGGQDVSDADRQRCQTEIQHIAGIEPSAPEFGGDGEVRYVPDSSGDELEESDDLRAFEGLAKGGWWDAEPGLGRVVDGMAHRVDRVTAIGNGQVPAVVRVAWEYLLRQVYEK